MCDTFIIPPALTENRRWIFAKNSDREPNEAQDFRYFPAGSRSSEEVLTSFIPVTHPRDHIGTWLSKPFHLWGAEMGINDAGLAIGNEAVFTRVPMIRKNLGLTGMDMIRLALERCRRAREAVDQLCYYIEAYGQDACGGYYNRKFFYHNSFIVADPEEAYVLESAGRHWVFRRLSGFYAISNRLTIGTEWDAISPQAISFAHDRGWIKKGSDFSFADAYTAPLMSRLSHAAERRQSCSLAIQARAARQGLTTADAIAVLRAHPVSDGFTPSRGNMQSVCLHATGLLTPSQTTASLVAELSTDHHIPRWATASAAPCLGLFKPFYAALAPVGTILDNAPGAKPDGSYWWQWEAWHRRAIRQYREAKKAWQEMIPAIESAWMQKAAELALQNSPGAALQAFSTEAVEDSLQVLEELQERLGSPVANDGSWLYRAQWKQWNRRAGIDP